MNAKKMRRMFLSAFALLPLFCTVSGVGAEGEPAVEYLCHNEESGAYEILTCETYTTVGEDTTEWRDGFYVVDGETAISGDVTVSGNVGLILKNGGALTIDGDITVRDLSELSVYGQPDGGTGSFAMKEVVGLDSVRACFTVHGGHISASCDTYTSAIGACCVTVHGGSVRTVGNGHGIYAYELTVDGGNVDVRDNAIGLFGADFLTVKGGSVNANGCFLGLSSGAGADIVIDNAVIDAECKTGAVFSNGGLKLKSGRVNAKADEGNEAIYALSYEIGDGLLFRDKDGELIDTPDFSGSCYLIESENTVEYLDYDNAVGGYVTKRRFDCGSIDEGTTELGDGWYAVKEDTVIEGTLALSGKVHIILMDGCTLTADSAKECFLGEADLYIHAQSTGENAGKLVCRANVGLTDGEGTADARAAIDVSSLTVNGGDILAAGVGLDWNNPSYQKTPGGDAVKAEVLTVNGGGITVYGGSGVIKIDGRYQTSQSGTGIRADKVVLNDGSVTAVGGRGDYGGRGGDGIGAQELLINGGSLTATGGRGGDGVGGKGAPYAGSALSIKKEITMNGGSVTAVGGTGGAAPWSGTDSGAVGRSAVYTLNLTIYDGTLTAVGGEGGASGLTNGSGDGGIALDIAKTLRIYGGTVSATGGHGGKLHSNIETGVDYTIGGSGGVAVHTHVMEVYGGTVAAVGGDGYNMVGKNGGAGGNGIKIVGSGLAVYGGTVTASGGTNGFSFRTLSEPKCISLLADAVITGNVYVKEEEDGAYIRLPSDKAVGDYRYAKVEPFSVDYLCYDETGKTFVTKTCKECGFIDEETTELEDGWYVVKEDTVIEGTLALSGEVHIILTDGCTLTADSAKECFLGEADLYIHAQSTGENAGKLVCRANVGLTDGEGTADARAAINVTSLTVDGGEIFAAGAGINWNVPSGNRVPGGDAVKAEVLTVNGGEITVYGGSGNIPLEKSVSGAGFKVGTFILNGGSVTAFGGNGDTGGSGGIGVSVKNILVNGGSLTATGGNGGEPRNGLEKAGGNAIHANASFTLNDGTVTAVGGTGGEGIWGKTTGTGGLGGYAVETVNMTVNGGILTAVGGCGGISGSDNLGGDGGTAVRVLRMFRVYDGTVSAAGGCGGVCSNYCCGDGGMAVHTPAMEVYGGTVAAVGGDGGSRVDHNGGQGGNGIYIVSSGLSVYGGAVTAMGGSHGLSAGTSSEAKGILLGTNTVITGNVYVKEEEDGAFIRLPADKAVGDYRYAKVEPFSVDYLCYDETGKTFVTKTCAECEFIDSGTTELESGLYVVKGQTEINGDLNLSGEVHIILMDGSTLTVNGTVSGDSADVCLHAQSVGGETAGKLICRASDVGAWEYDSGSTGIPGNDAISVFSLTLDGAVVEATGGSILYEENDRRGICGKAVNVGRKLTVNGGVLTANGGGGDLDEHKNSGGGIAVTAPVFIINGGVVTANGGNAGEVMSNRPPFDGGTGIIASEEFTVNGGTVTVTGGNGGRGYFPINGGGRGGSGGYGGSGGCGGTALQTNVLTVNMGTMTAVGGEGGCGGDSMADDGGDGGKGGKAITAARWIMNDGVVTVTGGKGGSGGNTASASCLGGMGGDGEIALVITDMVITDGSFAAFGGSGAESENNDGGWGADAIYLTGSLCVYGGEVTAEGGGSGMAEYVYPETAGITLAESAVINGSVSVKESAEGAYITLPEDKVIGDYRYAKVVSAASDDSLTLDINDGVYTVTAAGGHEGTGIVIVALYGGSEGRKLLDVKLFDLAEGQQPTGEVAEDSLVTAMWWSDMITMTPLCPAVSEPAHDGIYRSGT